MAYRYFAVDVGDKRVGLAVSDALGITAQGIETYNRTGDDEKDGEYIANVRNAMPPRIVFGSRAIWMEATALLPKRFVPLPPLY